MLASKLFALLAVIAGAVAAPVNKRAASALPFLGGVNLAGCDFGMSTNGDSGSSQCPPLAQIAHFVNDGANVIRLPVGWQYLVGGNVASTSFDESFISTYDALVQEVLKQGAYPIIDIHNYARWNGGIIGQGGPSNEDFASLWSLLATKYAKNDKVIFGLMNEPHDVDITKWAATLQAAVTAIRKAGATTQTIILPGNDWTHISDYYNHLNDPVLTVTDGDDTSKLILEVHQYLDSGSGGSPNCQTDGTAELGKLSSWLAENGRQAILTETGGGNNDECTKDLGAELSYVKDHADTLIGFTVWSAGSFQPAPGYELSITPSGTGSDLVDNALFNGAIKPYLPGASGTTPAPVSSVASSAAASATVDPATSASTIVAVETTSNAQPTDSGAAPTPTDSSTPADPTDSTTPADPSDTSVPADPSSTDAITDIIPSATVSSSDVIPSATGSSTDVIPSATDSSTDVIPPATNSSTDVIPSASVSSTDVIPSATGASTDAIPSATASSAAASPTGGAGSGGLQTYTGALGGISAPAVTASGTTWTSSGRTYNFLIDALNQSCYVQMDQCQLAANKGGNQGELTVEACNGQQIQACLAAATSSASA